MNEIWYQSIWNRFGSSVEKWLPKLDFWLIIIRRDGNEIWATNSSFLISNTLSKLLDIKSLFRFPTTQQ